MLGLPKFGLTAFTVGAATICAPAESRGLEPIAERRRKNVQAKFFLRNCRTGETPLTSSSSVEPNLTYSLPDIRATVFQT